MWESQSGAEGASSVAVLLFVNSEPSLSLSVSISLRGTFCFSTRISQ